MVRCGRLRHVHVHTRFFGGGLRGRQPPLAASARGRRAGGDSDSLTVERPHATSAAAPAGSRARLSFWRLRRETSVFIEGGRIRRIGAEVGSVPSGTFTIDGAGRFAIPGLFDMHVHASWMVGDDGGSWDREREFDPLQVFLAYGLTSVREPGGRLAFVNALADRTRMTSDPLPRFFSSGEIFEGTEQFTRFRVMGLPLRNEDEARTYARLWKGWGADFIKVYPSLSWPLQRAVNEEARRQGLSVVGHGSNGVEEMVKSVTLGYTSIEHCLLDRPYDDLLQLLASAGTRWVPTLSALGVGGFEVLSGEMQRLEDPKFRAFYRRRQGGSGLGRDAPSYRVHRREMAKAVGGSACGDSRRPRARCQTPGRHRLATRAHAPLGARASRQRGHRTARGASDCHRAGGRSRGRWGRPGHAGKPASWPTLVLLDANP